MNSESQLAEQLNSTKNTIRIVNHKEKPGDFKTGTWTRLITDEKSLIRLANAWDKLADKAGVRIYSRFEWLNSWWKHFGRHPKRELFIITVYRNRQLIGIAPFYLGRSSIGPVTFQRRLQLMGCGTDHNEFFGFLDDYGYSDFLDVIADPGYRKTVAECISDILLNNPVHADTVSFQHVNDESFVNRELLPCLKSRNIHYQSKKTDECPYLTLPDTLQDYIDQTGPSSRRRRLRKNLEAAGDEFAIEEAATPEKVQESLEVLIDQHQERWNSLGYPGAFFDHRHLRFVKEISQVLSNKGWLWFKFARDKMGCSAFRLAINDGNSVYDWLSGFDDSFPSSKSRPGLGLLAVMIREAINSRASRVELMRGSERYKFDFTSESSHNWKIILPLYRKKSGVQPVVEKLLNGAAKIYYRVTREWKLLRVQYRQAGLLRMVFRYGSFRLKSIMQKE